MGAVAIVAIVVALTSSAFMQRAIDTDDACTFADRYAPPDVAVTASPELAAQYRHWQPPHSPEAITAVDLTRLELTAGQGAFFRQGPSRIQVMNISDRTLDMINVMLHVGWGDSGVGTGSSHRSPLAPGERATLELTGGRGSGTNSTSDLPTISAYVSRVRAGACVYMPARRAFVK